MDRSLERGRCRGGRARFPGVRAVPSDRGPTTASPRLRSKVESRDIVQSVFADLLHGVRDGGWHFAGRPQLEAFLRTIAWRRLADRYQKYGRALEREQSLNERPPSSLDDAGQARPSEEVQGRELWEQVLRACPRAHHEVVRLRMSGHRMGESPCGPEDEASVRRILHQSRPAPVLHLSSGGPA